MTHRIILLAASTVLWAVSIGTIAALADYSRCMEKSGVVAFAKSIATALGL